MQRRIGGGFSILLVATVVATAMGVMTPAAAGDAGSSGTAMVSSANPIATQVGVEILEKGGNAFDAAIAVSFALTVVESNQSSAVTGDGFGLFYTAESGDLRAADWTSRTPLSPELVERIDELEDPLGPLSLQAPTGVAGLLGVHEEYASMPLDELLAPAIGIAENGFPVNERLHGAIAGAADIFSQHPQTAKNFLVNGNAAPVGHIITLPELADTMRTIAAGGKDAFYKGEIAEEILAFVEEYDGILTQDDLDLASEAPIWSEPLSADYRGRTLHAVPPAAGGIPLLETMNILEGFDLSGMTRTQRMHAFAEAFKLVFIDMDEYFGDPEFVDVPIDRLISQEFADERQALISPDSVLPWTTPGVDLNEDANTSHFNVVDAEGNVASITQTRSDWGVKTPVGDTGMFIHNGIRLLSADPDHPMYAGQPGMRLQKSMTPVLVTDDQDRPVMAVGSAGVRRITQATAQVLVNHLDLGMGPQAAIDAPRVTYQQREAPLTVSPHLPADVVQALADLGHDVVTGESGRTQAITIDPETGTPMGGADIGGAVGSTHPDASDDHDHHHD